MGWCKKTTHFFNMLPLDKNLKTDKLLWDRAAHHFVFKAIHLSLLATKMEVNLLSTSELENVLHKEARM